MTTRNADNKSPLSFAGYSPDGAIQTLWAPRRPTGRSTRTYGARLATEYAGLVGRDDCAALLLPGIVAAAEGNGHEPEVFRAFLSALAGYAAPHMPEEARRTLTQSRRRRA